MTGYIVAPGEPLPAATRRALRARPAGSRILAGCASPLAMAEVITCCWDEQLALCPVAPGPLEHLAEWIAPALVIDGDGVAARPQIAGAEPPGEDLALILTTSGSTGEPKGIMLPRAAVESNARLTAAAHKMGPGEWQVTPLPLHHCNALVGSVLATHLAGAGVACLGPPFNPGDYMGVISAYGARTATIVPALLHQLLAAGPRWPGCLDYLLTAAAPLTAELAYKFAKTYGPRLIQGYGLTETVNFSTLMPLLEPEEFAEAYIANTPPAGLPVDGTEIRVTPRGEVQIRTADRMSGYWRDDTGGQRFTDGGWLRTGDMGHMRGPYLVLSGRADDVINRGGEKIHPAEIEAGWERQGLARPFAAAAVDGGYLGAEIGLWTAGEDLPDLGIDPRPATAQACRYPQTPTGKPQRRALTASAADPMLIFPGIYEQLLSYAATVAETLHSAGPLSPPAKYIELAAVALSQTWQGRDTTAHGPAGEALQLLAKSWPQADGLTMMRAKPGLWARLMAEPPMGSYAQMAARRLAQIPTAGKRVLEVGAGTGATSRPAAAALAPDATLVLSDADPLLAGRLGGPVIDVTRKLPGTPWDVIYAVNALHCAPDRHTAVANCAAALAPGGMLLLAEGQGPTTDGTTPWALNILFGAFHGWWNTGGFAARYDWLAAMRAAGLTGCGYAQMRAGRHDLGGIIWGSRP